MVFRCTSALGIVRFFTILIKTLWRKYYLAFPFASSVFGAAAVGGLGGWESRGLARWSAWIWCWQVLRSVYLRGWNIMNVYLFSQPARFFVSQVHIKLVSRLQIVPSVNKIMVGNLKHSLQSGSPSKRFWEWTLTTFICSSNFSESLDHYCTLSVSFEWLLWFLVIDWKMRKNVSVSL